MKPRLFILLTTALVIPATADQPTDPPLDESIEEAETIDGNTTTWVPRLYGDYAFLFHNTEYDDPPAPRSDERSYLRQALELGALWEFGSGIELRAGLELEHDIADALDSFEPTWDSFQLHPRLRLRWDWGWGALTVGHLEPTPHPRTLHPAPYDQPPAGLAFTGDFPWLDWELWAARISRVGEDSKETFLAAGCVAPSLHFGGTPPVEISLPLRFAYSHAGGYDTADYQCYSPPDGVRKEEVWNLVTGIGVCFELVRFSMAVETGLVFEPQPPYYGVVYADIDLEGPWWSLGLELGIIDDGFRAVRPRPDLSVPRPLLESTGTDTGQRFDQLSLNAGLHYSLEPLTVWADLRWTNTGAIDAAGDRGSYSLAQALIIALGAEVSF